MPKSKGGLFRSRGEIRATIAVPTGSRAKLETASADIKTDGELGDTSVAAAPATSSSTVVDGLKVRTGSGDIDDRHGARQLRHQVRLGRHQHRHGRRQTADVISRLRRRGHRRASAATLKVKTGSGDVVVKAGRRPGRRDGGLRRRARPAGRPRSAQGQDRFRRHHGRRRRRHRGLPRHHDRHRRRDAPNSTRARLPPRATRRSRSSSSRELAMWSYSAPERRPRPAEPAGDGSTSYDGKDRTVSRSKNSQEVPRLGKTRLPPTTSDHHEEPRGARLMNFNDQVATRDHPRAFPASRRDRPSDPPPHGPHAPPPRRARRRQADALDRPTRNAGPPLSSSGGGRGLSSGAGALVSPG